MFHFFAIPILSLNMLFALYNVYRAFVITHRISGYALWNVLMSAALIATCLLARYYGLKNQDRLIRLEERMRLATLLPAELRGRISEFSTSDLIGLRFCSDEELPEIAGSVLRGEVKGREAIKKRVQNWRPDYHRL
jgi:hypothetical protein